MSTARRYIENLTDAANMNWQQAAAWADFLSAYDAWSATADDDPDCGSRFVEMVEARENLDSVYQAAVK